MSWHELCISLVNYVLINPQIITNLAVHNLKIITAPSQSFLFLVKCEACHLAADLMPELTVNTEFLFLGVSHPYCILILPILYVKPNKTNGYFLEYNCGQDCSDT